MNLGKKGWNTYNKHVLKYSFKISLEVNYRIMEHILR